MDLSLQTKDLVGVLGYDRAYGLLRKYGFSCVDWNLDSCWSRPAVAKGDLSGGCVFEKPLPEVLDCFSEELAAQKKYGIRPGRRMLPIPPGSRDIRKCLNILTKFTFVALTSARRWGFLIWSSTAFPGCSIRK